MKLSRERLGDIIFKLQIKGYLSQVGSDNLANKIADEYEKGE